jgi:salicylate hydroxylase
LFERNPLPEWTLGRVALLGDACHPMLPFMAQGAAQAIEDGATLAACLRNTAVDVPTALKAYFALRKPRTTILQERSEAFSRSLRGNPEAMNRLYGHDAEVTEKTLEEK